MSTHTKTTILMIATLLAILIAIPLKDSQAQPPTDDPDLRPLLQVRIELVLSFLGSRVLRKYPFRIDEPDLEIGGQRGNGQRY